MRLMPVLSRREFGGALMAGLPLAALMRPVALTAADAAIGVSTSSFSDLPRVTGRDNIDDVVRALQAVRATQVELAFANVEPAPPSVAPVMGGSAAYPRRIVLTPEQAECLGAPIASRMRRRVHAQHRIERLDRTL